VSKLILNHPDGYAYAIAVEVREATWKLQNLHKLFKEIQENKNEITEINGLK